MTYSSEVLADSPLFYWRMGDPTGALATDSSGNGRDGTITNTNAGTLTAAGLLASDTDPSFNFDGVNDFISLGYGAWGDVTSFTVEALVNLDTVGVKERVIFIRLVAGGNEYIRLSVLTTGAVRVGIRIGGTYATYTTASTLTAGTTYHLAATYDQTNVKVYINGTQALSTAKTGAVNVGGTPVIRAAAYDAANFQLDGRIDELAFYGAGLSAARVGAHYTAATTAGAVSGSLAASLPMVSAALAGLYTPPVLSGSLDVVLPALATDLAGAYVAAGGAVTGSLAVDLPALDVSLSGTMVPLSLGTRADVTSARHRGGIGFATWMPAVDPTPAHLQAGYAVDKALAFGPVTVVGTQPTFDVYEAETVRHRDRIIVGGRDVTYFRGAEVVLSQYQLIQPFAYGTATLEFPQVFPEYEELGAGDLDWLKPGNRVIIQRVDTTGTVVATDFKGILTAPNASTRAFSYEVGGQVTGPASLRFRPLPLFRSTQDVGWQIWRALSILGVRTSPRLGVETGIELARVGGMPFLDYLQQLVGRAWTRNGRQWTVMPNDDGVYETRRKNLTTIAGTVYTSTSSVEADLRRDITEEPNRVFATGVTPEGKRIRFGRYPGLQDAADVPFPGPLSEGATGDDVLVLINRLRIHGYLNAETAPGGYDADVTEAVKSVQEDSDLPVTGNVNQATWDAIFDTVAQGLSTKLSRIEPAAQKSYTRKYRTSASGAILGRNPNYDPTRLKIDRDVDFGSGFYRSQQREWSKAEVADGAEPNWVGTLTIHSGAIVAGEHVPGTPIAAVMPARDIRPGMNLWLPQFQGGTLVHVTAATVSGAVVTLQVDTRARDAWNVAQVIERDRESRKDPARAFFRRLGSSTVQPDAMAEFSEVGGIITKHDLRGGEWNVIEVVAGDTGTIRSLRLDTNPNAESSVAIFGKRIWPNVLQREIGDPLTRAGTDRWRNENVLDRLRDNHGLLYSAGDVDSPGGYSPGIKDDTAVFTGRLEDEAGVQYYTERRPILYVAVWVDRDCAVPAGRILWPQLEVGI